MKFWLCIPIAAAFVGLIWGGGWWILQSQLRIQVTGAAFIVFIVSMMLWSVTNDKGDGPY